MLNLLAVAKGFSPRLLFNNCLWESEGSGKIMWNGQSITNQAPTNFPYSFRHFVSNLCRQVSRNRGNYTTQSQRGWRFWVEKVSNSEETLSGKAAST